MNSSESIRALALASALLLAGHGALSAQPSGRPGGGGPGGPGMRGMEHGPGITAVIDAALENREALELSDEQVSALEDLHADAGEAIAGLRSGMRDARVEALERRDARRQRMRALSERVRTTRQPLLDRFRDILTPEQRLDLRPGCDGSGPCGEGAVRGPAGGRGADGGPGARGRRGGGPHGMHRGMRDGMHHGRHGAPRQGPMGRRGDMGPGGAMGDRAGVPGAGITSAIDRALDDREALQLTDEQVRALEALRADAEESLADLRERVREVRAEALVERDRRRERMQAMAERMREVREPLRDRLHEILTPEQRLDLQPLVRRGRGARGGAWRDGPRGGRGPGA